MLQGLTIAARGPTKKSGSTDVSIFLWLPNSHCNLSVSIFESSSAVWTAKTVVLTLPKKWIIRLFFSEFLNIFFKIESDKGNQFQNNFNFIIRAKNINYKNRYSFDFVSLWIH